MSIRTALLTTAILAGFIFAISYTQAQHWPERTAAEHQIATWTKAKPEWRTFKKVGVEPNPYGGTMDVWAAEFKLEGHEVQMHFLTFHNGGELAAVPLD